MSLIVGRNTYITLEEAETIIKESFLSSDKTYQQWKDLDDNDKAVLLSNSCRDIDALKFDGRRKNLGQALEFPRVLDNVSGIGYSLYTSQFIDNGLYSRNTSADGGISAVKIAQALNAVYACYYTDLANEQIGLGIQGLTSKRAGPISETYSKNKKDTEDALMGIYTKKVYSILRPWLNDSRIAY